MAIDTIQYKVTTQAMYPKDVLSTGTVVGSMSLSLFVFFCFTEPIFRFLILGTGVCIIGVEMFLFRAVTLFILLGCPNSPTQTSLLIPPIHVYITVDLKTAGPDLYHSSGRSVVVKTNLLEFYKTQLWEDR